MTVAPTRLIGCTLIALSGLAVAGCTSSTGDAAPSSAVGSMSTPTPSSAGSIPGVDPVPTDAGSSAAPSKPAADAGDPAYTVTSAILAQLSNIPAASLTSELVTIAVSPQLRQVAEQYGVTTGIDVKGANVSLSVDSDALRCTVTVADPPESVLALDCKKR